MEIAVLSDIHGNYIALEQCVRFALERGITTFIFLGDYLGDLAYPQRTMKLLYSLNEQQDCYFIKGNKEDYWLHYDHTWKEHDSTTGALYDTFHNLTDKDLNFFRQMEISKQITFDGYPVITACHGSPNHVKEKMLQNDEKTFSIIENQESDYILCGHTHVQNVIEHNGKIVWNPGSVGVSLHSKGKAQFLILKGMDSEWTTEFIALDYDVEQVIHDLHQSGLYKKAPGWCKVTEHLLRTGEISHGSVLHRAMALCSQKEGSCSWPDIPEKYWQQAIEEIIGAGSD